MKTTSKLCGCDTLNILPAVAEKTAKSDDTAKK